MFACLGVGVGRVLLWRGGGGCERVLYAHAAVAQEPRRALEEASGRRVVQVDVVFVRAHELDLPEWGLSARVLPHGVGEGILRRAVPRRRPAAGRLGGRLRNPPGSRGSSGWRSIPSAY